MRQIGAAKGDDRLIVSLGRVAMVASEAAKIRDDAGVAWGTTFPGKDVLPQLRDAEVKLSAACR